MMISLTPEQELFIKSKIATGKYQSTEEIFEVAFKLLEEYRLLAKVRQEARGKRQKPD